MRHLSSGEDCAIAGEATAATAAPVADTFKKSRRFIQASPCWGVFPDFLEHLFLRIDFSRLPKALWRGRFNTEVRRRKRNKGMTALIKRKSHAPPERGSGRSDDALQLDADLGADRAGDRRVRAIGLVRRAGRPAIRRGAARRGKRTLPQNRPAKPLRLVPRS